MEDPTLELSRSEKDFCLRSPTQTQVRWSLYVPMLFRDVRSKTGVAQFKSKATTGASTVEASGSSNAVKEKKESNERNNNR